MSEKRTTDWEGIEREFRAGVLSVREIAALYSISHTGIIKRSKKEEWTRDLSAKIKAKAAALVSRDMVSKEVTAETKINDAITIEVGAQVQARVQIAHRTDIARMRKLVGALLSELEQQTDNIGLYQELGEMLAKPDDKGIDKLNELYHKVIALPARTKTLKDLADSLKTLVAMEREAYGIDSNFQGDEDKKAKDLVDPMEGARRIAFALARADHALQPSIH